MLLKRFTHFGIFFNYTSLPNEDRLPGKSAMEPRIFKFGTPYEEMYNSMSATPEDEAFFVHNGVLQLCRRGAAVKVCLT
jgi:hypothetical protein